MFDPNQLKGLLNKGGPIVEETKKILQDPEAPIRTKVALFSTMVLPEFRKLKNMPQVAMMLPFAAEMAVVRVKAQFKTFPKQALIDQIDAEIAKIPEDFFTTVVASGREELLERIKKEAENLKDTQKLPEEKDEFEAKLEAYIVEIVSELSEDEYVELSTNIARAIPSRLLSILTEGKSKAELLENARKSFREFKAGTQSKEKSEAEAKVYAKAVEKMIASDEIIESLSEAFAKVNGEKLFGIAEDIIDGLDAKSVVSLLENGLQAAEDALVAAKTTGNPLKIKSPAAAEAVIGVIGAHTQLIEDAIVKADILPSLDLNAFYKKAADEARVELGLAAKPAAVKAPKPKGPKA